MFASLNISIWQASVTDRAVAMRAEIEHDAENRTIKATKRLVPPQYLIPIKRIAQLGRDRHKQLTLPGLQEGMQLLATKLFDDYAMIQSQIKDSFFEEVKRFEDIYPSIIEKAPARLGKTFRPEDFPAPEKIASFFSYDVRFHRVPDSGNWLLDDVDMEDMDRLRNEVETENNNLYREASRELFDRGRKALENLFDQATNFKEGQSNGAILRDATLNSVKEMAYLISAMNITGDPVLDVVSKEMQEKFIHLESKTLRNDAKERASIADIAKQLLGKMDV